MEVGPPASRSRPRRNRRGAHPHRAFTPVVSTHTHTDWRSPFFLLHLLLPSRRGYLNAGRGHQQNHHHIDITARLPVVHLLHGPACRRRHCKVRTHRHTTHVTAMSAATACMPLVLDPSPLHGSAAMADAVERRQPGGMETTKTGSEGTLGRVVRRYIYPFRAENICCSLPTILISQPAAGCSCPDRCGRLPGRRNQERPARQH